MIQRRERKTRECARFKRAKRKVQGTSYISGSSSFTETMDGEAESDFIKNLESSLFLLIVLKIQFLCLVSYRREIIWHIASCLICQTLL